MTSTGHDFDVSMQSFIDRLSARVRPVAWRSWLDVSTSREYEYLVEANLNISIDALREELRYRRTDPATLRVDPASLDPDQAIDAWPVACHTSGTSGKEKWYPVSRVMVDRCWGPGMQAIFEAAGATRQSTAVVLVPTRMAGDGLVDVNGGHVARLYSAEFSQRLALSLVNPTTAIVEQFKRGSSLDFFLTIIDAGRVDVVSAPATTILAWTRRGTVEQAISVARRSPASATHPVAARVIDTARVAGDGVVAKEIHGKLLKALRRATFIFGTTSVTTAGWAAMRDAFEWERGRERVVNVYVSSETGPLAASIDGNPRHMRVLPLLLACLDGGTSIEPISRSTMADGTVLVSRPGNNGLVVNVETGDRAFLHDTAGLPVLGPAILRDAFLVTDPSRLPLVVPRLPGTSVLAGDYLVSGGFRIENPSLAFDALKDCFPALRKPLVFIQPAGDGRPWILRACFDGPVPAPGNVAAAMAGIPETAAYALYHQAGSLVIEAAPCPARGNARAGMLRDVRAGKLPKGVLKRWAAHVVVRAVGV